MKRMSYSIIFLALTLLLFSACQSNATVTPVDSPSSVPAETTPPLEETLSYPAPDSFTSPPIEQTDFLLNLYPGPIKENASFVDWVVAEKALMAGDVVEVYEDNSFHVTLILKSGEFMLTVQPAIDEVTKTLERCGDLCKDTLHVTE